MFDKAQSSLASLFGQLAEAQKAIDDSARKIVDGIVRMIDAVSQVYDQLVVGPSGAAFPALTDLVASDYGRDI